MRSSATTVLIFAQTWKKPWTQSYRTRKALPRIFLNFLEILLKALAFQKILTQLEEMTGRVPTSSRKQGCSGAPTMLIFAQTWNVSQIQRCRTREALRQIFSNFQKILLKSLSFKKVLGQLEETTGRLPTRSRKQVCSAAPTLLFFAQTWNLSQI